MGRLDGGLFQEAHSPSRARNPCGAKGSRRFRVLCRQTHDNLGYSTMEDSASVRHGAMGSSMSRTTGMGKESAVDGQLGRPWSNGLDLHLAPPYGTIPALLMLKPSC